MRRDALLDRALGYALVPLAVGLVAIVSAVPGEVIAGAVGIGIGVLIGDIKKILTVAEASFTNRSILSKKLRFAGLL
jgi:hypothetical protein